MRVKHPLELKMEANHRAGNRAVFCDMDGVKVDFGTGRDKSGHESMIFKLLPGSYRNLKPIPDSIDFCVNLIQRGWDLWNATKIPTDNPYAAAEKLFWVDEHEPWMKASTIITPNKGCLGDHRSVLIDDRPHKAMCSEFKGTLLDFGPYNTYKDWIQVMEWFDTQDPTEGAIPLD